MEDDPLIGLLLLQLFFILLNAVFACAEIAVLSVNEVKLNKLAAEGDKRAARLSRLTSQPARFLATIQISITLAGFLGSAFAADNFADRLVEAVQSTGVNINAHLLNNAYTQLFHPCFRRACAQAPCHEKGRKHCPCIERSDIVHIRRVQAHSMAAYGKHQSCAEAAWR